MHFILKVKESFETNLQWSSRIDSGSAIFRKTILTALCRKPGREEVE
jgi:hypothetical protein